MLQSDLLKRGTQTRRSQMPWKQILPHFADSLAAEISMTKIPADADCQRGADNVTLARAQHTHTRMHAHVDGKLVTSHLDRTAVIYSCINMYLYLR